MCQENLQLKKERMKERKAEEKLQPMIWSIRNNLGSVPPLRCSNLICASRKSTLCPWRPPAAAAAAVGGNGNLKNRMAFRALNDVKSINEKITFFFRIKFPKQKHSEALSMGCKQLCKLVTNSINHNPQIPFCWKKFYKSIWHVFHCEWWTLIAKFCHPAQRAG